MSSNVCFALNTPNTQKINYTSEETEQINNNRVEWRKKNYRYTHHAIQMTEDQKNLIFILDFIIPQKINGVALPGYQQHPPLPSSPMTSSWFHL